MQLNHLDFLANKAAFVYFNLKRIGHWAGLKAFYFFVVPLGYSN